MQMILANIHVLVLDKFVASKNLAIDLGEGQITSSKITIVTQAGHFHNCIFLLYKNTLTLSSLLIYVGESKHERPTKILNENFSPVR